MGFFEVLIALAIILVLSLILSFIAGAMVSTGKDNSGGVTMLISFVASVVFLTWGVFFWL